MWAKLKDIRTWQRRLYRDARLGDMMIRAVYIDRPATIETWIDHITELSQECGVPVIDVHQIMFRVYPEIFGA